MRIFGEVGVKLDTSHNLSEKLRNKGNLCFFCGFPENHPINSYRVYDVKTQKMVITRDIRWLNVPYGDYFKKKNPKNVIDTDIDSSDEEIEVLGVKPADKDEKEEKKNRSTMV